MSASPFRARQIPPAEVRKIVKRAAEIADLDPHAMTTDVTLTEEELEQRLAELGIAPEAARKAMAEETMAPAEPLAGGLRVLREAELAGMVPEDRHEDIADAITAAMVVPGRVNVVGKKITWTAAFLASEPLLTIHSKDGRTRIRVAETLANPGQMAIASLTAGAFAALIAGGLAVEIARSPVIAIACAALAILGAASGVRKLFARRVRTRTAELEDILAKMVAIAREAVVEGAEAGGRVRVGERVGEREREEERERERERERKGESEEEREGERER